MTDRLSSKPNAEPGIDRREFIGGVAAATVLASATRCAVAGVAPQAVPTAEPATDYPPALTGLRGQYPGSFEMAHAARDGEFGGPLTAEDTGERYDLVVVGGGISGLSSAYFFHQALGADRKVLILDNHDDFGGHAKRNEFHHDGRMYLAFGGTMSIETPFPYSYTAKTLIADLGIDVASYEKHLNKDVYSGLESGVFFDREHFNGDRLVAGVGTKPWPTIFAEAPLSPRVRADLIRLHTESVDYLPGLSQSEKIDTLKRVSYQEYLLKHARLLPESLAYFAGTSFRNNMRVDTCPAYTAFRYGAIGFAGAQLPADPIYDETKYNFHFPDGNATIARLLVSRLVPGVFPGQQSMESIVTAPADYRALDHAGQPTRIRLKSTVVRVEHLGGVTNPSGVRVVYSQNGRARQVVADNVVLACFNNIIRFIVPSLPDDQKKALAYASKVPLYYTNVLIRNWESWKRLGVKEILAPNGYYSFSMLNIPVSLGEYKCPTDPREPMVVWMVRNPNKPGLSRKEQQRVGRAEMLATSFDQIERETRSQLDRMLGAGGFDARRDILALTVNRWAHGYAYSYDTLGDPDMPDAERPHIFGRRAFGRIAIANADAGAAAFTNVAIDQAQRAVQDCLLSRGLT
jgi:spermidine dehydrogenase